MKSYLVKEAPGFDSEHLKAPHMSRETYVAAHEGMVIPCHDIFIKYNDGLLLVVRDNLPAKGMLWPIGGRIARGLSVEDSLRKKVREECNLDLENIAELGYARVLCTTDPFGHGRGTDSIGFVFYADGKGDVKLDHLHRQPIIVKPNDYTTKFRESLDQYVADFMDIAMDCLRKKQ